MVIAEIAPEMGITVELEPEYRFAGELTFPNGKRHLFRNTNLNINPAGSTEIAKDKGYTNYFLRKHGFRVPEGRSFFSPRLNRNLVKGKRRGIGDAVLFAEALGLPVFVKPNNLSQGTLVTKIYDSKDIPSVARAIFRRTNVMLVEECCQGRDYRVVVLGDSIISAYERIPLSVIGDGRRSIDELIFEARKDLTGLGRPNSEINPTDWRIDLRLAHLGINRSNVVTQGQRLRLLDNANLSSGGNSIDVTQDIHPSFVDIAIRAAKVLGLRLAGIDIICDELSVSALNQTWGIIEVNAAPGLDNYASLGEDQAKRVKGLYRCILEYLASHD